jgi:hypothetical protein
MTARRSLLALVLLAAMIGLPAPAHAATKGIFSIDCFYSHSAPDDPIVSPGQPGASHLHDFYGNTTTDNASTEASLRAGATKCHDQDDDAGYWNPAGYYNGVRLVPKRIAAYYVNNDEGSVESIPAGLQMVGGDAHSTAPEDNPNAFWFCGVANSPQRSHPYSCATYRGDVTGVVKFPSCWDGSGAARSDVAYPNPDGTCPAQFSHEFVTLSYRVHFGITDPCGGLTPCDPNDAPAQNIQISLSSGEFWTLHADFWNTWNQQALDDLVARCNNAHVECGKIVSSPTIPSAPKLYASGGEGSVDLSWTPTSDGGSAVTGYVLYRGTSPAEEQQLTTLPADQTTYQDADVTPGTAYYYRVLAQNDVGEGALSSEPSATPSGTTTPSAPTLSARPAYRDGVRLAWTLPDDGGSPITGYRIYKNRFAGKERYVATVTVRFYHDTKTREGVRYFYQVVAVNDMGESPRSNEASAIASR